MHLPKGAIVLNVDFQEDELCIWALVDPNKPTEDRFFLVLPTGLVNIPDDMPVTHIKTLLHKGGDSMACI